MTAIEHLESRLRTAQLIALAVGVVGTALAAVGWVLDARSFFRAYLFGYLPWWEIAVGCLGLAMLYQLAGGKWGAAARPFFDAGARTLPLLALLFVPIGLGLSEIYPWANASWLADHQLNANRQLYLEPEFFLVRAGAYFLVWIALALVLTWRTVTRDGRLNTPAEQRLNGVSGLGLVLLAMTVTYAGLDWMMTLDPYYKSTMFGGIILAGTGVAAMAAVALAVALVPGQITVQAEEPPLVLNDLGNLLLAFVMVWTYVMFGQFLITWMGNLPEEVMWYEDRQGGGWQTLIMIVILFHFILPVFLLLFRGVKRTPQKLFVVALLVLLMRFANVYWEIAPSWSGPVFQIHWLDFVTPLAVGGLWTAEFLRNLKPRLAPFLKHDSAKTETRA